MELETLARGLWAVVIGLGIGPVAGILPAVWFILAVSWGGLAHEER